MVSQYNDEKYCKNQASLYLIAGGGITLALTGLKILTCFICDSKCYAMLSILVTIGSFGFAIWGAVAIFGNITYVTIYLAFILIETE